MTFKSILFTLRGDLPLARLALAILSVYGACLALAHLFADRMIFHPQPTRYRESASTIRLTTADGARISAVWLPNPRAVYTILYSHGNAEDLGDNEQFLSQLRDLGFSVFAYDYHGYGTSQGRPSERNTYLDIAAAYDYLTRELRVPPQRIIAHGSSVGGGPTLELAAGRPLAGVILEAPFITAFRVVTRVPLFPVDRFRNIDKVGRVRVPLLVIHGMADSVIPPYHGERIFAAANEPKRMLRVEGANHNDLREIAGERYWRALRDFADLLAAGGG